MFNETVTQCKKNVIKFYKQNSPLDKYWYDRYKKAGGKLTFNEIIRGIK